MLKRILASLALTSLLLTVVILVYWWRARHGYVDTFSMGKGSPTESIFTSQRNFLGQAVILVEVTSDQGSGIVRTIKPYAFRDVLGYFLLIPGFWLAIKVRSLLPRPPGRGRTLER